MRTLLGPEGPLAARFAAFEERESQIAMAEAVDRTLTEGGRLLVEAGTGTGKTFAYLLPALLHAELPHRRVVISTWTRNLQEQLIDKDLPMLRELLGVPFEVALVQGRQNYVCRRRAELTLASNDLLFDTAGAAAQLRRIVGWAATGGAMRASLAFEPRPEVWAAVRAERGTCLGPKSPFFQSCVWQEAKRKTRDASVLVVNHALLLEDLKLKRAGGAVLPPYSILIVDEAHHLEEVAGDHLGSRVAQPAMLALLRAIGKLFEQGGAPSAVAVELERHATRCRAATLELFGSAARWLAARPVAALEPKAALPGTLPLLLGELFDLLIDAAKRTTDEAMQGELLAKATTAQGFVGALEGVLRGATAESVAFVEKESAAGSDVALCVAPIEPGPILARELFAPLSAAILTSATLAVAPPPDRFSWLRRGTGVGAATGLVLLSPFDYRRQVLLVIDPLPEPTDPVAWTRALIERIPFHVNRRNGRAFVLFTSRKTMEAVADGARPEIERSGVLLLVQGRGMPRGTLLQEFVARQPAVLFGLASFWEGVDVPGEELSHVILTRLPFPVPDHPLEKARGERLAKQGLDPFHSLSLPKAVLRFKQGFGRLIRRKDDTGIVTVLDARILRRGYGRVFLDALPDCPKVVLQDGEEIPLGDGMGDGEDHA